MRMRQTGTESTRLIRARRRLSPLFATLVIFGVLAIPRLDFPGAGIAGWGLATVAAAAWLFTALRPQRSSKKS
ncbi:hypothetical protein KZO37_19745 [Rhodococcus fascians]|uniref:hypothetical protein n=2 Tax=Mycobacteriales TaxID=85007 RepID=UPI001C5F38C4|nr:hypothetical protein [Rhodococcus fascians]MBW4781596.1 hypothetical protein [Rhodococcus fascians]MDJ0003085.1 hypothetical protein [Rhodococcus fascians]